MRKKLRPYSARFLTKDPLGLYKFPNSEGASVLNMDEGTQMLIGSYLNQANGNTDGAWNRIVSERNARPVPIATGQAAANAAHYLMTRSVTEENGLPAAVVGTALVTGYSVVKSVGQTTNLHFGSNPDASPASMNQAKWGIRGIVDGLRCPH